MVKFEGKVNGQTFDNVADYNQALQEALNNGDFVNASSRTYTSTEKPENEGQQALAESDFQQISNNYDVLPKVDVEDLDKLNPVDNEDLLQDWADRFSIYNAKRIVEDLNNCDNEDLRDEYRRVMKEISDDLGRLFDQNDILQSKVDDALKSLDVEMDNANQRILVAEAELKEAQSNLCNIKSRMNVVLGDKRISDDAKSILDLEDDFYTYIYNNAFCLPEPNESVCSCCGNSPCTCGTREARRPDPDALKALSKLIQDVFGVSLKF